MHLCLSVLAGYPPLAKAFQAERYSAVRTLGLLATEGDEAGSTSCVGRQAEGDTRRYFHATRHQEMRCAVVPLLMGKAQQA